MKSTAKLLLIIIHVMLSIFIISCQKQPEMESGKKPVKVIFDMDMGPDYGDADAIAVLHALGDNGECEILATVSSNSHLNIVPVIEAFNRYYNRPDISVDYRISFSHSNKWNDSIIVRFAPDLWNKKYCHSATQIYRRVLSSQPDTSVTIITVGFTTNLESLLKSCPDEFSSLTGMDLIKQKVRKWVAMAGKFSEGHEYNVYSNTKASRYVLNNWPTRIIFSGWEIGNSILTGSRLVKEVVHNNPIARAYKYNFATYAGKPVSSRMSWDQTDVLCAVRGPENNFYICDPGKFEVEENGYNRWNPDIDANHYFIVHKYPYNKIAEIIENLMMQEPGYYELDARLKLVKKEDLTTHAFIEEKFATPEDVIAVEESSVLVVDDKDCRWRLPLGSSAYLELTGAAQLWICREVATERDLFHVAGVFYELPTENTDEFAKIRPVASHNFRIHGYASYRDRLVMTGITLGVKAGYHIVRSDDGKAAGWLGAIDDLWKLSKPVAHEGPRKNSAVKAGGPSDPHLIGCYDERSLEILHNAGKTVTFRIEADPTSYGPWMAFKEEEVKPGSKFRCRFPEGFHARWIRFVAITNCAVTAWLRYK